MTHKLFPTIVYRNTQRRYETLVTEHEMMEQRERTSSMKSGMESMSFFSRKSPRYVEVCAYFDSRRQGYLVEGLKHYAHVKYRQRSFLRDRRRQKSEATLINCICRMNVARNRSQSRGVQVLEAARACRVYAYDRRV
jgi:hypothetical protein